MDIKNLIHNAEKIKNKQDIKRTQKKVLIKRFLELGIDEPYVVFEKPTTAQILAIQEHKEDVYAIAECMITPDTNDIELQKAYGVNNAEALVRKLFTEEELQDMSSILGEMITTREKAQIIDDIKN